MFAITDAAAKMQSVSSIIVTVDSVRVHSAAQGWLTVSSTPKTYDLLKLKAQGNQELLADAELIAGTYDQLRLDISSVSVTDSGGKHDAKLPSGELKIIGILSVSANSTSTAEFDFMADKSLHVTGNGKYVMAPVVKMETKENADVEIKSDEKVEIKGGSISGSVKVGMDANGNVGEGMEIPSDADISIESSGKIKIKSMIVIS